MTKIINAKIHNFMGVSDIQIAPNGKSLIIGGANGQGKSSLIKALMVVGGKKLVPARPVKDGAGKAEVEIEIETAKGRFVATFEAKADRVSKLTVENEEGMRTSSPQTFLDSLFSGSSFDPGAFKSEKPTDQKETLLKLVGLDFSGLDRDYESVFAERTVLNRELTYSTAQLDKLEFFPEITGRVSQAEILKQIEIIRQQADDRRRVVTEIETLELEDSRLDKRATEIVTEIKRLEKELENISAEQIAGGERKLRSLSQLSEMPKPTREQYEELQAKLANAEEHNTKAQTNELYNETKLRIKEKEASIERANKRLFEIRNAKAEAISNAKFPILGLGFDETGVTYNGRPLAQASEAEQWKVSLAIGFALNPDGVLFMPTTGGLDKNSRVKLIEQAEELGVQLILEVIDEPDDVSLVVEAGRIKR